MLCWTGPVDDDLVELEVQRDPRKFPCVYCGHFVYSHVVGPAGAYCWTAECDCTPNKTRSHE